MSCLILDEQNEMNHHLLLAQFKQLKCQLERERV
jgi:hypothetical protein